MMPDHKHLAKVFSLTPPWIKSPHPLVQFHARGLCGTLHFSSVQPFNDKSCIPAQDRSWYVAKKVPFSLLDAFYPRSKQLGSACKPTPPVALIFLQSCCPFSLLARVIVTRVIIVTQVIIAIISGCPEVIFTRLAEKEEGSWWNPCMRVSR